MSKELECIKVKSFGDSYVVISVCKKNKKTNKTGKKHLVQVMWTRGQLY